MSTEETPNYELIKPAPGTEKDIWGPYLNTNADIIDTEIKNRANEILASMPKAGGTFTGKVIHKASAADTGAGVNFPQGNAPSTPVNGDFWSTSVAFWGRLNGITYQLATTQDLAVKAPLVSPDFTGIPLADTAPVGTNTRQIATTAFVKAATATPAFDLKTANYILVPADVGKVIAMNMGAANTWTIPNDSTIPVDSEFHGTQYGAGQTTIVASGVTVRVRGGLKAAGQFAGWTAKKISSAEWIVWGDLIA